MPPISAVPFFGSINNFVFDHGFGCAEMNKSLISARTRCGAPSPRRGGLVPSLLNIALYADVSFLRAPPTFTPLNVGAANGLTA